MEFRLAEIQMSDHERVRAAAHLQRAEVIAELLARAGAGVSRLAKALVIRPLQRLAHSS